MKRTDVIGVVAAFMMGAFIVIAVSVLVMYHDHRLREDERIRACVAGVPGHLDAQEIVYMEQECRAPWAAGKENR